MTLSLFINTIQTNRIQLHQQLRLLSTSKLPIKPDSNSDQTSNHNQSNTISEEDTLNQFNTKQKISNHLSLPLISTPIYLRPIKQQLSSIQSKLSRELVHLPTKLSKLTGYGEIDQLKRLVSEKEINLKSSRAAALEAKINFNQAAQRRAESIKEVNDLLARKASWSDQDLARFTTLVRTDHANEQAELEAKKLLENSELQVDHQFSSMMQAILTRYHEEQIWSDKIRALSTTFSLSITLINVLVFLAAIVLVEPYKRSKVVSEVEARIAARDSNNTDLLDRALNMVVDRLSSTEKELSELILALKPQHNDPRKLDEYDTTDTHDNWSSGKSEKEMELEHQEKINDIIDERIEESFSESEEALPPADQPKPNWTDKFYEYLNIYHGLIRDRTSDQDLLKGIGLGAVVGFIVMASFEFFSRKS